MPKHTTAPAQPGIHLNTYCPHCKSSLNVKREGSEALCFKTAENGQEGELVRSAYLDTPTAGPAARDSGPVIQDLLCPHCNESLVSQDDTCGHCGAKVGQIMLGAPSKLLDYYVCLDLSCTWNGLTKVEPPRAPA